MASWITGLHNYAGLHCNALHCTIKWSSTFQALHCTDDMLHNFGEGGEKDLQAEGQLNVGSRSRT